MAEHLVTDVELMSEALSARARQMVAATRSLVGRLATKRAAGRDVRSSAVRLVDLLAQANQLDTLAAQLRAGALGIVAQAAVRPHETDKQ